MRKKKNPAQKAAEKVKGRPPKHYKGYVLHYEYVTGQKLLLGVVPTEDYNEIVSGLTIKELDQEFKTLVNKIKKEGGVHHFRDNRRGKRSAIKEFLVNEIIQEKSAALSAMGMLTSDSLQKIKDNAEWEWMIKWLRPDEYNSKKK